MYCACLSPGDREAETKVDERLLIPFRQMFSWCGTSSTSAMTISEEHGEETDMNLNVRQKQVSVSSLSSMLKNDHPK